jgi:cold shock CspA family protein
MAMADEREEPADRFYPGTIRKLYAGSGFGLVRSDTGREIPFAAAHVLIGGRVGRFDELREGMRVGFDVGWTSHGLRVTVLRVRDDAAPPPPPRE